jgi:hypothetical protein
MSPPRAGRPSNLASNPPDPRAVVDVSALLGELEDRFELARKRAGTEDLALELAGRDVLIRFAGPAMRDALGPAFGHLVRTDGVGDPSIQIDVWDGETSGVEPPPIRWEATELDKLGVVPSRSEDRLYAMCDVAYGAITVVDPGRHFGLFQVPSASGVPWYERAAPLRVALNHLLFSTGASLVHAGAVGDERGGALLVGQGGSGKSTLAVAAAIEGLGFAGDDYVAITLDDGPAAHSVHSTAKLTERSLELLPSLGVARRPLPVDEKHVIQIAEEHPSAIRRRLPLTAIVSPRITEGTANWRRISGAEGLRSLAPSTMLQLPATGAGGLSMMASLARSVPSYSLELGGDPRRSVNALQEILADAA